VRPLFAAVAVVLALLVPFTEIALARPAATIECCCGRHDANKPCDCPDCPAAHTRHNAQVGTQTAEPCHGPRTLWHSAGRSWIVAAPATASGARDIVEVPVPRATKPMRSRTVPAPTPPPRVRSSLDIL